MTASTPRRDGVDLPDFEAVREEVRHRAFLILGEGRQRGQDRSGWRMKVSDEEGGIVLSMTLAEATLP